MKISTAGLRLVQQFEGCLAKVKGRPGYFEPYICPAGVLTIGWGHTNSHGRRFDRSSIWSQEECDRALYEDMSGFERDVERLVKVNLNQNQFDALVSFAYNVGSGALGKSTLLRKLNAGDYDGAADEFGKWVKGGGKVLPGLVKRRAAEAKLFRLPAAVKPAPVPPVTKPIAPADPMPQQVDPPAADKPSIFERAWTWVTGGGIASFAAFMTDWRVVAIIVIGLAIGVISFIVFMGPDRVRVWIRERVNR